LTEEELEKILNVIKQVPVGEDETAKLLLKLAAESITLDKLKNLTDKPQGTAQAVSPADKSQKGKKQREEVGYIKFNKKELECMPKSFQNIFAVDDKIVKYRYYKGLYQARYRRDGYNIEVASKNYDIMKKKFIEHLTGNIAPQESQSPRSVYFSEYAEEWLKIKEQTCKPSTYKEYVRMYNVSLKPVFGKFRLNEINRAMIQEFLFGYIKEEKHRIAEKLKLELSCIFDMATEDFNIPSPLKKVVLPHYESKQGTALTKDEEKILVDYCTTHRDCAACSALLVLLYFGLRRSELTSIKVVDGKWLECETSKERMGKNVVLRKIPFTPVLKKVLPFIDFDKAKGTNPNTLTTTLKRLLPTHHPHELRHTFVSRCKEAGVTGEVVSIWAGHSLSGTITSTVYTHYSEEFQQTEAEKVNYAL